MLSRAVWCFGGQGGAQARVKRPAFSVGKVSLSFPPGPLSEGNRGVGLNAAKSNYLLIYSHVHTMVEG